MRDPFGIVGTTIDKRYAVRRVVAEGGFGVVYEAEAIALGVQVALKVLRGEALEASAEARARFEQEAKLLARLKHPAIVELSDAAHLEDGTPYLVLAWIEGETLDAMIRRRGPLGLDEVIELLSPAAEALSFAHGEGVVHRDLKPANLMIVPPAKSSGRSRAVVAPRVRILDFGVARWASAHGIKTATTSKTGLSIGYAAPEQYGKEFGPIDGRTDQFALAAIVHASLTGKAAFPGETVTEVFYATCAKSDRPSILRERPELGDAIDAVLQRALAVKSEGRFASIEDFWSALAAASKSPESPRQIPEPTIRDAPVVSKVGSLPAVATLPSPERRPTPLPENSRLAVSGGTGMTAIEPFASTEPARVASPSKFTPAGTGTVREGEPPPSSKSGSRLGRIVFFLALGGIVGGAIYAAVPFFSHAPPRPPSNKPAPPSSHSATSPSASTSTSASVSGSASASLSASSSSSAPPLGPCGVLGPLEVCIESDTFRRGPPDCGTTDDPPHKAACPESPAVMVKTFALDRDEVSVARYKKCVDAGSCGALGSKNDDDALPVRNVAWKDAGAFCAFDGKRRLPTDDEWEFAAAGHEGRLYPWGNANVDLHHAVFYDESDPILLPEKPESKPAGKTADGVFDLAGNVAEWTGSSAGNAPAAAGTESEPGPRRWVRGGSYADRAPVLRVWMRDAYPESFVSDHIGFRCARPGS